MTPQQATYIPAGTLRIERDSSWPVAALWPRQELGQWRTFIQSDEDAVQIPKPLLTNPDLNIHVQDVLFRSTELRPYIKLFEARWIALEFKITAPDHGTVRVHLLPDDVHRRLVDRSNLSLNKLRQTLVNVLNYSSEVWAGDSGQYVVRSPTPYGEFKTSESTTLLELFNKIPSPDPDPDEMIDGNAQDAMADLLESQIAGLTTELYPYQRRSAASMVQREFQPGQVLDPRLVHVKDQDGKGWYLDSVSGTVLLEPRFYDGIPGGILAEEMGSGKTIICLALILSTRDLPTQVSEWYGTGEPPTRPKIGSLCDMAASCATRNAVPWRPWFEARASQQGYEFTNCKKALERNPGFYFIPPPDVRRVGRHPVYHQQAATKVYLSNASLIIVPTNLVAQWKDEIQKHTKDLKVLVLVNNELLPPPEALLDLDIILFSQTRFDTIPGLAPSDFGSSELEKIHFKRCIVDEGHKIGNARIGYRSNLVLRLNKLRFSSRWIVTGTPSHGLFGVDDEVRAKESNQNATDTLEAPPERDVKKSLRNMEKKDLERIGAMAALYLKARPWANTAEETGDTTADWGTYLLLPRHSPKGKGRWECLKTTLDSLIIRHQLTEVKNLLPPVDERIVVLDGSYQDQLSMNIFSMMIIFNSVQSQRTDMDYFFHPKQRKSLLQIVHNLKQASFFGGSFFTSEDIAKSVKTAEDFLSDRMVSISEEDEILIKKAIRLGQVAVENSLRNLSNTFHEMPVWVEEFPGTAGPSWSLGDEIQDGTGICTSASLLLSLQKLIHSASKVPDKLNALLNGGLALQGNIEREKLRQGSAPKEKPSQTLAGNTKLGSDSPRKSRSHTTSGKNMTGQEMDLDSVSIPLESTKITATVSAKLSYLIDSIVKHQEDEKILVFYENENIAWYLGNMLELLQIQHLIYAKSLTTERKAQYVKTFHNNRAFRVLLMDLSQAAFGLDMREASRIYFISPVLNPQVEAQAIGRARRISQKKPVSVETLVLRNSMDEVILERKKHMTQAEHRQVKSILDVRPIYNWIKNANIIPLPESSSDSRSQMTALGSPQQVFGRGFGRTVHPDEGLLPESPTRITHAGNYPTDEAGLNTLKREHAAGPGSVVEAGDQQPSSAEEAVDLVERPARRVRFAGE